MKYHIQAGTRYQVVRARNWRDLAQRAYDFAEDGDQVAVIDQERGDVIMRFEVRK